MARLSDDDATTDSAAALRRARETKALSSVLQVFDEWRHVEGASVDVRYAEQRASDVMQRLHEALPELDRARLYSFFLTGVQRNAVIRDQFRPSAVASPGIQASIAAEHDNVSIELEQMIDDVAVQAAFAGDVARSLAADFLWSMSWWIYARRDVPRFPDTARREDHRHHAALGRAPDSTEHVAAGVFEYASRAFEAHCRSHERAIDLRDVRSPGTATTPSQP